VASYPGRSPERSSGIASSSGDSSSLDSPRLEIKSVSPAIVNVRPVSLSVAEKSGSGEDDSMIRAVSF
jgi:hypothetical protein